MTQSKLNRLIMGLLLLLVFAFTAWGAGQQPKEDTPKEPVKKEETQKAESSKAVSSSIDKRMAEGESLFKILGLPEGEELVPNTLWLALFWLFPLGALVGILVLIIVLTRQRHRRIMAMIDKGTYPPVTANGQPQPAPFKWDVFCLLAGLILMLGGVGVSLFMMGYKGFAYWYAGMIPLLLGAALLLFYRMYYKK